MIHKLLAVAGLAASLTTATAPVSTVAYAQEVGVQIVSECPETLAATAICAGGVLILSEAFKERPFGKNGLIAKAFDVDPSEWVRCGFTCSDASVASQVSKAFADFFGW